MRKYLSGPSSAVALLIAAACGAVVFTLIAGALVYNTTQKLISTNQWVGHTREVLNSLQRASLLTERIEYRTRLNMLTGDAEQLSRARASVILLNTTTAHLRTLIADNRNQDANIESLSACAAKLTKIFERDQPQPSVAEAAVQPCQQTLGLMTDQEQSLLDERTRSSEQSSFASVLTEIAFVALSLITLLVLFGFLMRDAIRRQRLSKEALITNERLAQNVQALEDRAHESRLLTSARDEIQLCVDLKQVYQASATALSRLLPGAGGCLCMINNSRQVVEVMASWGSVSVEDFSPPESCCGLRSGQARWRLPGMSEIDCTHFAENAPARYLCQPIAAHGDTLGILFIECESDEIVRSVQHRIDGITQLVQIIGMAVAALNLQAKLENQSIRDSLTGLFNRHFMQMSMERELARAVRRKQTLAVLMIDVDHFKRFNDANGHPAGDAALEAVADIFKRGIRAEDIACRYGGEEFTVILPDTTVEGAYARAESLRSAVEKLTVVFQNQTYTDFSISIGMAFFPTDGDACDLLLRHADLALYRSKRRGRNQVSLYETPFAEQ